MNESRSTEWWLPHDEARELAKNARHALTESEQNVLDLRLGMSDGIPRTLAEVSSQLGTTQEEVRQIEATAIAKLHRLS